MTNLPSEYTLFEFPQFDAGRFIKSEAGHQSRERDTLIVGNGTRSRDKVTLQAGCGMLEAGTVLGKIADTEKYIPSPAIGDDGSQNAVAVLFDDVDATGADDILVGVIARDAEVLAEKLIFDVSVNSFSAQQAKWGQLALQDIIVRGND